MVNGDRGCNNILRWQWCPKVNTSSYEQQHASMPSQVSPKSN